MDDYFKIYISKNAILLIEYGECLDDETMEECINIENYLNDLLKIHNKKTYSLDYQIDNNGDYVTEFRYSDFAKCKNDYVKTKVYLFD